MEFHYIENRIKRKDITQDAKQWKQSGHFLIIATEKTIKGDEYYDNRRNPKESKSNQ